MKLALVRQQYTDFGGAERYTAALAEHLLAAGHEVHIFAHEWKTDAAASKSLIFHRVPMLGGLSVCEALSFARNTKKLLRREPFDIIHSFERTIYQDIYRAGDGCHAEWLIQRRKIDPPYKRIINRINPLHLSLLRLEKQIFAPGSYRLIIANSERGKKEIMRHYGVPAEKIRVVYNAVDLERFRPGGSEADRSTIRSELGIGAADPMLLYVGSGFKRKGVAAAIRALSCLPDNTRLVVVGRERLRPYQRLAARHGLAARVHFTGPVRAVERYYRAADLFVFPTVYEPFSNACLEAMAAGLPVVTSRINGAAEVIREGGNGFLIDDPTDAAEIAGRVRQGLQLDRSGVAAVNRELLPRFTWTAHIRQMADIYAMVLDEKTNREENHEHRAG